jgi:beta-xylosidase
MTQLRVSLLLLYILSYIVANHINIVEPTEDVKVVPFTNPIADYMADPYILRHNGIYFLYATSKNFAVYQSTDLTRWEYIGDALNFTNVDAVDLWAPEAEYRNGKFYLYVCKLFEY